MCLKYANLYERLLFEQTHHHAFLIEEHHIMHVHKNTEKLSLIKLR